MDEPMSHAELVLLYRTGELEAPARESFKAHLAACSECQAASAQLSWGSRLAQEGAMKPSAKALGAVFDRTQPRETASWRRWGRAKAWGLGLGLAFAAALLLLRFQRGSERELVWRNGLDEELSELDRRLGRLDAALSHDAWAVEFKESLETLSRQQRGLARQLARPEGV